MYAYIKNIRRDRRNFLSVIRGWQDQVSVFPNQVRPFPVSAVHGEEVKVLYLSACAGGCDDLIWFSQR